MRAQATVVIAHSVLPTTCDRIRPMKLIS